MSLWGLKFVKGVYSEMSPFGLIILAIALLGILFGLIGITWGIVKMKPEPNGSNY